MKPDLKLSERQILAYVINELKPVGEISFCGFPLNERDVADIVAYADLKFDVEQPIFAVFTLGRFSDNIFITLSDGDPIKVGNLLASIEQYDSTKNGLDFEHSMLLDSHYLRENGRVGVSFLRISTHQFLGNFPDSLELSGRIVKFLLVVFLSADEYAQKINFGFDALLDKFSSDEKDLYFIKNPVAPSASDRE